eukprot:CAMPEP_0116837098 /NCGR_PEP_ID=MMETSP0418-20121206/8465_1 /TAXON_ID=1158023 /ORGANISM="Astrosyne radiata, Strain 13vi08-1A" /LENGTH=218 /DNA_ID=CAMNT_0004466945 /DNA_START=6 /DNA_END=662 /DNA_ORIENTATION=-
MNTTTADTPNAAQQGDSKPMATVMDSVKEKWNTNVDKDTRDYIDNARQQFFNKENLRSFSVFFGIGEENAWSLECCSPAVLLGRLQHNLKFFYLNYMIVFAILFVSTVVTSFKTLIGVIVLAVVWFIVNIAIPQDGLKMGGCVLSQKNATIALTIISAIVLFYLLSHVFWLAGGSASFLVLLHASLRDASIYQHQQEQVEMSGNLSPSGLPKEQVVIM